MLGASLANAKAAAAQAGVPLYRWVGGAGAHVLPVPLLNVVNGGAHAANSLDLQEFMIVPGGAETFAEGLRIATEVYHALKALLEERGLATAVGDEGGFAPDFGSSEQAIEAILEAAERAGHLDRIAIALDPAMSELLRRRSAIASRARYESSESLVDYWAGLIDRYPIVSIEDGAGRGRLGRLEEAHRRLGDSVQLIGDDLFVTNVDRLERGIRSGVANAILIKVNQIGTLTETLDAIELARANGYASRHLAPLRRDRGHDDRRPRGGDECGPDQDRRARPQRPRREVQPAAEDRGGTRAGGVVSGLGCVSEKEVAGRRSVGRL